MVVVDELAKSDVTDRHSGLDYWVSGRECLVHDCASGKGDEVVGNGRDGVWVAGE